MTNYRVVLRLKDGSETVLPRVGADTVADIKKNMKSVEGIISVSLPGKQGRDIPRENILYVDYYPL